MIAGRLAGVVGHEGGLRGRLATLGYAMPGAVVAVGVLLLRTGE